LQKSDKSLGCDADRVDIVKRFFSSRAKTVTAIAIIVVIVAVVIVGSLIGGGQKSNGNDPSTTAVLDAAYAKSVGFSKTYESAKKSSDTGQKGCSNSVESIYENLSNQTALISEVLNCKTSADASASLTSGRKEVQIDSALKLPKELGSSAFATATEKPEYLIVWTVGKKVAIVGLDVNIEASTSTSTTAPIRTITKAQQRTLINAAVMQNSLYG
jgi:hypothetical protein